MESVNGWIQLVVGVLTLAVACAGIGRWLLKAGLKALDNALDETVDKAVARTRSDLAPTFQTIDRHFDAIDRRFDAFDARFDTIDRRLGAMDARLDSFERVVDIRLSALESDMTIIKQRLIGTSAA